ncbi:hypothetical protein DFH06DRAFT_1155701 [Mycena polygramma]|nr:hypothetical protein DFH06DRAFT_1155701 [Mycena polygramma]
MELDALSFHGINAYLQDPKGKRFPLGKPSVNGNTITAVIELDNPRSYSLEWSTSLNARAISAWCEVFRPSGKAGHVKVVRIANHYMAENDPQTQSRSSRGRLELPLHRDAWLWTPRLGPRTGFVTLEIRRLRKPPRETKRPDDDHPGSVVYETDVEMLDDDDDSDGAGKPPHIIFRFDFKPKQVSDSQSESPLPLISRRTIRRSPLRSKGDEREISSDLSELSSDPEPEGPSPSVLENKQKNVHQAEEDTGATSNDNGRSPSGSAEAAEGAVSPADAGDIDLILKKRKLIIQQQEELEEEKRLKRVKREKLVQDLWEDTTARAEKLAEEQHESQQLDDEIQKIQAALHAR